MLRRSLLAYTLLITGTLLFTATAKAATGHESAIDDLGFEYIGSWEKGSRLENYLSQHRLPACSSSGLLVTRTTPFVSDQLRVNDIIFRIGKTKIDDGNDLKKAAKEWDHEKRVAIALKRLDERAKIAKWKSVTVMVSRPPTGQDNRPAPAQSKAHEAAMLLIAVNRPAKNVINNIGSFIDEDGKHPLPDITLIDFVAQTLDFSTRHLCADRQARIQCIIDADLCREPESRDRLQAEKEFDRALQTVKPAYLLWDCLRACSIDQTSGASIVEFIATENLALEKVSRSTGEIVTVGERDIPAGSGFLKSYAAALSNDGADIADEGLRKVFSLIALNERTNSVLVRQLVASRTPFRDLDYVRQCKELENGTVLPPEMRCEDIAQVRREDINKLKTLTAEQAQCLIRHYKGQDLALNGVTILSDEVAEVLASHDNGLNLNGLASLSEGQAKAFAKHRGSLHLDGLRELPPEVAECFVERRGPLRLNGLTVLSDEAADALVRMRSATIMARLTTISDIAAQAFADKQDCFMQFGPLTNSSDKAKSLLRANKNIVVMQPVGGARQGPRAGFRDREWGSPPTSDMKFLRMAANGNSVYEIPADNMAYGMSRAKETAYAFRGDKLCHVTASFERHQDLVPYLTREYGDPSSRIDRTADTSLLFWSDKRHEVVLLIERDGPAVLTFTEP